MKGNKMSYTVRPHRTGIEMVLGPLEHEIMHIVWQSKRTAVRPVYEAILAVRPVAYTTISTTMTRLAEKGLLRTRRLRRRGEPLIYHVVVTREDLEAQIVADTLNAMQRDYPHLVAAWIAQHI